MIDLRKKPKSTIQSAELSPAPAVPEAVTQPEPIPTAEELQTRAKERYQSMGWGNPPAPALKTDVIEVPAEVTPDPAPATVPAAVTPVQAPEPVVETEAEPSTRELISRTASETAKAVANAMRPAPAAPAPVIVEFEMSPDDSEDYKVLKFLQASGDPKFKDVADKFLDYVKKHYAYQDEWAAQNPGKEFNPDEDEHKAWYELNQPDIHPKVLESGRVDMKAEELYNKRLKPELDKITADKALEKGMPVVATNVTKGIIQMVKLVDPELVKMVTDAAGNPDLSEAKVAALGEHDPIAKEVLDNAARAMEPMLLELELTAVPGYNYSLNPNANAVHRRIDQFRQKYEADLVAAPEHQIRNGKQFCTVAEMQSNPALSKTHWCLTIDDLVDMITDHYAAGATKEIQKLNALAEKKYKARAQPSTEPVPEPAKPTVVTPVNSGKPKAPSISSGAESVTTPAITRSTEKSFADTATKEMFG